MIRTKCLSQPYQTQFTNDRVVAYSDIHSDKGGKGEGFRPHDLLEAALACCINMSVRMYTEQHALSLSSVATIVNLDRSHEGEVCFEYDVSLVGDLSESERQAILAMVKTCPVRRTLLSTISFRSLQSD
ncbi:OsmC family protein [Celerinatantimonas sp. YJH-8]|uniref:OsmC family protein n=1 Tax=Celerinatantimonas sp. YJH-8 TaxID=3228714 RepID=UPI0038C31A35